MAYCKMKNISPDFQQSKIEESCVLPVTLQDKLNEGIKFNIFNKLSILFIECFRWVEDQAVANRLKEI